MPIFITVYCEIYFHIKYFILLNFLISTNVWMNKTSVEKNGLIYLNSFQACADFVFVLILLSWTIILDIWLRDNIYVYQVRPSVNTLGTQWIVDWFLCVIFRINYWWTLFCESKDFQCATLIIKVILRPVFVKKLCDSEIAIKILKQKIKPKNEKKIRKRFKTNQTCVFEYPQTF